MIIYLRVVWLQDAVLKCDSVGDRYIRRFKQLPGIMEHPDWSAFASNMRAAHTRSVALAQAAKASRGQAVAVQAELHAVKAGQQELQRSMVAVTSQNAMLVEALSRLAGSKREVMETADRPSFVKLDTHARRNSAPDEQPAKRPCLKPMQPLQPLVWVQRDYHTVAAAMAAFHVIEAMPQS